MRVYADHVVFSRREFMTGASLGDDLVMPLPAAERRPFEFAGRAASAKAPAFPAGAALSVARAKARLRGRKKGEPADVWELVIPAATAEKSARAAIYEVVAKGPDGFSKTFGMSDPGMRFPPTDARCGAPKKFRVACSRLPEKGLSFSVSAISCWGRRSSPLTVQA